MGFSSRQKVLSVLILIVMVGGIGALWWYGTYSATDYAAKARDSQGEIVCRQEAGLPGAATGKLYDIQGDDIPGHPTIFEGRVYHKGDYLFLGYCGPDGKAIR